MKTAVKIISSALVNAMLLLCVPFAFATQEGYTITNPYADINWTTVNQYKTALHTHTNASDGDNTLAESIERHYETGYDIVSVSDHGVSDVSWTDSELSPKLVTTAMTLFGKSDGNLDYLEKSGTFTNGIGYEMVTVNGDDYLRTEDGREVLRVPYGIENNAVSVNAHVNSWFAPFSDNMPSDYRNAIVGVDKLGGISVINHPGEYTQARYELFEEDAYDMNNLSYRYFINKFYGYINNYDSCIGIDINSKGDGRTRFDRKLWDIMLTKAAESGKTVTAIASSDAHQLDKIDTGSIIVLAEDLTTYSLKNALLKGEILPQSTCIHNRNELAQIAQGLLELYGETDLYKHISAIVEAYDAEINSIIKAKEDEQAGARYTSLDAEGFVATQTRPVVNSIAVDEVEDTITIDADNALIIRWISDGKLIATTKADDTAFDLNDYEADIKGYIRAEIFGEGGVIYTEGFTLNADKATDSGKQIIIDFGFMDFLIAIIDRYGGLLLRMMGL